MGISMFRCEECATHSTKAWNPHRCKYSLYEKSLDPLLAGTTFSRVLDYMKFLGKNIDIVATSHCIDANQVNHITIEITYDFINKKAGMMVEESVVQNILKRLGFETEMIV